MNFDRMSGAISFVIFAANAALHIFKIIFWQHIVICNISLLSNCLLHNLSVHLGLLYGN